jgi:hypothetical protein
LDRLITYPNSIAQDTDLLNTNRATMVALGLLAMDLLGTSTVVGGMACTQTVVASLNVLIAAGRIYSLQNIDGSTYGSLASDTTHQVMKQGILLDAVTLATPAPTTAGQSINYLIQAAYQDSDTVPVVLPYFNASNPTGPALTGPGGLGAAQNTQRKGAINVTAKAGIPATTGTQTTPAADAGFTALYVVTVANGQASVTAGNIAKAPGAPLISSFVPFQSDGGISLGGLTSQGAGTINGQIFTALNGLITQLFPGVPASNSTTAATTDVGKCINATTNITIPNGTFSQGNAFSVYNNSAAAISLIAGVATLRLAGTTTTGTRTLAARGMATVWFESGTEAIVSGAGVT